MFEHETDQFIIDVIRAGDAQALPMERRFAGDDDIIRIFMAEEGMEPLVVTMQLVVREALREAVARGIQVPQSN